MADKTGIGDMRVGTEGTTGSRHTESTGDQAQQRVVHGVVRARGAARGEVNAATDSTTDSGTAQLHDGEAWADATGHSGTPIAWATAATMAAGFAVAGAGLLWQVWVMLWIGTALFLVVGAVSLGTGVWSDHSSTRSTSGR